MSKRQRHSSLPVSYLPHIILATIKPTYYVIDGNAYMYRAFFAIPGFTTKDGFPTNAVFGFAKMLLTLKKDHPKDHIIVSFDHKGKSFRSEMYEQYKAHREKMPDDLALQAAVIKQLPALFHMPVLEIPHVEADDSIASFVTQQAEKEDCICYIITGDKDMMQLVHGDTYVMDTMKNVVYDRQGVYDKMGVYPEQIIDLLGLMGDSSDNIPGVPGVGPKTAIKLLSTYKDIEDIYQHVDEITGSTHKKLVENKAQALLSKQLATIKKDIDLSHVALHEGEPDYNKLLDFLRKYECFSLEKEAMRLFQVTQSNTTTQTTSTREEVTSDVLLQAATDYVEISKEVHEDKTIEFLLATKEKYTRLSTEDFSALREHISKMSIDVITDYARDVWPTPTPPAKKEELQEQPSLF